ncbi:hypothetical protein EVAR_8884_1 [Eumeta japonica]|uniref:Uncharacterized protein n=1 Tax=Eumeta variegata TaxID=151549 RepID=A0A4C1U109_EUMVA|nr:hypothetical protein EVAR_8884_1 [Eumeta japonica]
MYGSIVACAYPARRTMWEVRLSSWIHRLAVRPQHHRGVSGKCDASAQAAHSAGARHAGARPTFLWRAPFIAYRLLLNEEWTITGRLQEIECLKVWRVHGMLAPNPTAKMLTSKYRKCIVADAFHRTPEHIAICPILRSDGDRRIS